MSAVSVIDSNGLIVVTPGTVQAVRVDNPAYRARIALALPVGAWLCAPSAGHSLDQFKNVKASDSNRENYMKSAKKYLAPYGPDVISRFIERGVEGLTIQVSQETIYG